MRQEKGVSNEELLGLADLALRAIPSLVLIYTKGKHDVDIAKALRPRINRLLRDARARGRP